MHKRFTVTVYLINDAAYYKDIDIDLGKVEVLNKFCYLIQHVQISLRLRSTFCTQRTYTPLNCLATALKHLCAK